MKYFEISPNFSIQTEAQESLELYKYSLHEPKFQHPLFAFWITIQNTEFAEE